MLMSFDDSPVLFSFLKLMTILDHQSYNHIVTWLPEGNGFTILNKKQFERIVLPLMFNGKKNKSTLNYSSFTRRMNRWNFSLCNVTHKCARYFHPEFIRGNYEMANRMNPRPQKQWRKTKDGTWMTVESSYSSSHSTIYPSYLVNSCGSSSRDNHGIVSRKSIENQVDINLAIYRSQVIKDEQKAALNLNPERESSPVVLRPLQQPQQILSPQYSCDKTMCNNSTSYDAYSYPIMHISSFHPQSVVNHHRPSYNGAGSSRNGGYAYNHYSTQAKTKYLPSYTSWY